MAANQSYITPQFQPASSTAAHGSPSDLRISSPSDHRWPTAPWLGSPALVDDMHL